MTDSQTVDRNFDRQNHARRLRWPIAVAVLIFTVSYPANDYITASTPTDIGLGMLLVFAFIAVVSVAVVFGLVLPWALRLEGSGAVAVALAIPGTLLSPGFWTGFPPALAAGGALLGWAGTLSTRGRGLSQAAFVIGVLGVVGNVVSYVVVFI